MSSSLSETLAFCGDECHQIYRGHGRRVLEQSEPTLTVLGITLQMSHDIKGADLIAAVRHQFEDDVRASGGELAIELLPSVDALRSRLVEGTLSLVRVTGTQYVDLRDANLVEPLARHETSDREFKAILVTRHESAAGSPADLRGKTLALARDRDGEIDAYLAHALDGTRERRPETFFASIMPCSSETTALRAVAFGQVQAAVVTSTTYETMREMHPGLISKLKRIDESDALRAGPICTRVGLEASRVDTLRDLILRLHETERGRAAMAHFRIQRFVEARDSDYDPVRKMLEGTRR